MCTKNYCGYTWLSNCRDCIRDAKNSTIADQRQPTWEKLGLIEWVLPTHEKRPEEGTTNFVDLTSSIEPRVPLRTSSTRVRGIQPPRSVAEVDQAESLPRARPTGRVGSLFRRAMRLVRFLWAVPESPGQSATPRPHLPPAHCHEALRTAFLAMHLFWRHDSFVSDFLPFGSDSVRRARWPGR